MLIHIEFDLQVKVEEEKIQDILLLDHEEYISEISCGALFTIALSSKGRLFGCGYQGFSLPNGNTNNEEYIEKAKFKLIEIDSKIIEISCGLSGAGALSESGIVYVWGRFGKMIFNVPKKIIKNNDGMISKPE